MNQNPSGDSENKYGPVLRKIGRRLRLTLIVAVILSPCFLYGCSYRRSAVQVTFTVDRRERVTTGSGDSVQSYYLVWSREGEVFAVVDSWVFWRWDSADRYGKLHEGSQITAKVAGWRVPFLTMYRNVIDVQSSSNSEQGTSKLE
jgi:hypothetical protein